LLTLFFHAKQLESFFIIATVADHHLSLPNSALADNPSDEFFENYLAVVDPTTGSCQLTQLAITSGLTLIAAIDHDTNFIYFTQEIVNGVTLLFRYDIVNDCVLIPVALDHSHYILNLEVGPIY
jgi:hypothetical protein